MSIPSTVINRPTTVIVFFIIIVGLAAYMFPSITIDMFPDTEIPMMVIMTTYAGAGPEEIEQNITKVLEGQLSNVGGLVSITSTSSDSRSMVMLEFSYSTDLNEATDDIRDKLEIAGNMLPDDAESPSIFKMDPNSQPIMSLVIKGDRTPEELRILASEIIQPKLERIDGVSATSISGGREKIVSIEVSRNRLEAYNLTLTQIASSLSSQNIQIGAGELEEGNKIYNINVNEEFEDIEEIKNTIIRTETGTDGFIRMIKLKDIAEVSLGYEDAQSLVYINGNPGVYISIQKESGSNSTQVSDNVKDQLEVINKTLPSGIKLDIISDTTQIIRNTINQIYQSLLPMPINND